MRGWSDPDDASAGSDQNHLRGLGSLLNLRIMSNVNASIAGYPFNVRCGPSVRHDRAVPGTNCEGFTTSGLVMPVGRQKRTCVLRQQ